MPHLPPAHLRQRILEYCHVMRLDFIHFGNAKSLDDAIKSAQEVMRREDYGTSLPYWVPQGVERAS
jgi:hypothetical protein